MSFLKSCCREAEPTRREDSGCSGCARATVCQDSSRLFYEKLNFPIPGRAATALFQLTRLIQLTVLNTVPT